jgi:NDP-sugar pyrophosphorylase family protein
MMKAEYAKEREPLNFMPELNKFSLKHDVYPKLIERGRISRYVASGYFRGMIKYGVKEVPFGFEPKG